MSDTIGAGNVLDVGEIENNHLPLWEAEGYSIEGDVLVKSDEKVDVQRIGSRKSVNVQVAGVGRTRIPLAAAFGSLLDEADYVRIVRGNRIIPISAVTKEKRIETTQYKNIKPGQVVQVELLKGEVILQEDRIPIATLRFEPYIRGEYNARIVNVKATKLVKLGIRAPKGKDNDDFMGEIYDAIRTELFGESDPEASGGAIFDKFEDTDYARESKGVWSGKNWEWYANDAKGNFPDDASSFRKRVSRGR